MQTREVTSSRAAIRRDICFVAPAAASIKFRSMQAKFEKFYSPRPHPENIKFSLLKFDVIFAFVLMGLNCAVLGGSSLLLLAGCLKQ